MKVHFVNSILTFTLGDLSLAFGFISDDYYKLTLSVSLFVFYGKNYFYKELTIPWFK